MARNLLEEPPRLRRPARQRQAIDHPETTDQKSTLGPADAIFFGVGVTAQERAVRKLLAHRAHGGQHARLARLEKPDQRQQKRAGVDAGASIALHEGMLLRVVAPPEDILADGLPGRADRKSV